MFLPEVLPAVEVGWRLARDAWGRGYATEAARAALAFGFEEHAMAEIIAIVDPDERPLAAGRRQARDDAAPRSRAPGDAKARDACSASRPASYTDQRFTNTGTTGFDVVGSVRVVASRGPGGLVKHRENHMCGLSRVRPRCLVSD